MLFDEQGKAKARFIKDSPNYCYGKMNKRDEILKVYSKVKKVFPFKGYMDCKIEKYLNIASIILSEVPRGSKILDLGCGACDLTAILAMLGYDTIGLDDLRDPWHLIGRNRERIINFAKEMGIKLIIEPIETAKLEENHYDCVLLIDILEHSLNPRTLLNKAIATLKVNGLLLIETSNCAALAKRIMLLLGKWRSPSVNFIYFNNLGIYRGHVREYTVSELKWMLKQSGLVDIKVRMTNHEIKSLICERKGIYKIIPRFYDLLSNIYPNFRDTVLIYGRKPKDWKYVSDEEAFILLKRYYQHLVKYNLDNESDEAILLKIKAMSEPA